MEFRNTKLFNVIPASTRQCGLNSGNRKSEPWESARKRNDMKIKAWVVFSGQTDLPWLRILKKGYRHCYILLDDGKHWITVDPLSNYTDISVHDMPLNFNLSLWMKNRGHMIVPATIEHRDKQAPWMPFSCVEAVKRILGIHNAFIFTPWQLYRYLQKYRQKDRQKELAEKSCKQSIKGDFAWEA